VIGGEDVNTNDRFCGEGGLLVGPHEWLPTHPADHRFTERHPRAGCNHLRCLRCDSLVVSSVSDDARHYRCRCFSHDERGLRLLDPRGEADHPDRALPWRCAGHPPLGLPAELDGEALSNETLSERVVAILAGHVPRRPWPASALDREGSAAWLARLYALLGDETGRRDIAREVTAALSAPAVLSRTLALDFFLIHPLAPGAERIAAALDEHPALFVGVTLPWSRKHDLAHLAWQVLVERLHHANRNGSPLDPLALPLARAHVSSPNASMAVLLRLGHWDRAWVLDRVAAIATANPPLIPSLLDVLAKAEPTAALASLSTLVAWAADNAGARAELSRHARRLPEGALRDALV
jgi:hypothetical protein